MSTQTPLTLGTEHQTARSAHADRIERYGRGRVRALQMAGHLRAVAECPDDPGVPLDRSEAVRRAAALETCGGWLEFRDYLDADQVRLTAAKFCQQPKLCPVCALRRAGRSVRKATEKVLTVLADRPDLRPYLVTLTVRNGPDLLERYDHLRRGLRLLQKRRKNALLGACSSVMSSVAGGAWSIELKRGAGSTEWHPHSHAVWLSPVEPSAADLSAEWRSITGDSHRVDVRPFHTPDDPASDLCEVFKYALKLGDLDLSDNLSAFLLLRARRFVGSFGCLFGLEPDPKYLDEPLPDDLPYLNLLYRHLPATGYRLLRSCLISPPHRDIPVHGKQEKTIVSAAS